MRRQKLGVQTHVFSAPSVRNNSVWSAHPNEQLAKTQAMSHQTTKFVGVTCKSRNVGSKENGLRASHIKWLVEVAGLSVKETAALMGCSYGTAYGVANYRTRALDEPIKPEWWDSRGSSA